MRSRRCAARRPELDGADPWEALTGWFERFIAYIGTKQALAAELLNYLDQDASLFQVCRTSLFEAGEPLLKRAQEAGVVRPDVDIAEVIQMVVGIAKIPTAEPGQASTSSASPSTACATGRRRSAGSAGPRLDRRRHVAVPVATDPSIARGLMRRALHALRQRVGLRALAARPGPLVFSSSAATAMSSSDSREPLNGLR